MNKDDSYERIANLLIDLKTALKDINELRNEPILLKIQSTTNTFTRSNYITYLYSIFYFLFFF